MTVLATFPINDGAHLPSTQTATGGADAPMPSYFGFTRNVYEILRCLAKADEVVFGRLDLANHLRRLKPNNNKNNN